MVSETATRETRFIRRAQVEILTGLSRSTLYRRVQEKTFPAPKDIAPESRRGSIRWVESEVLDWMDSCPRKHSEKAA